MSERHFTREEVDRLIPELARLMGRAMGLSTLRLQLELVKATGLFSRQFDQRQLSC